MADEKLDDGYRNYGDPTIYPTEAQADQAKLDNLNRTYPQPPAAPVVNDKRDPIGCGMVIIPTLLFYWICVYHAMGASAMLALSGPLLHIPGLVIYCFWWVIAAAMLLPLVLAIFIPDKIISGIITTFAMFFWMALFNRFIADLWVNHKRKMKLLLLVILLMAVIPVALAWYFHSTGTIPDNVWNNGWAGYDPLTALFYQHRMTDVINGYLSF